MSSLRSFTPLEALAEVFRQDEDEFLFPGLPASSGEDTNEEDRASTGLASEELSSVDRCRSDRRRRSGSTLAARRSSASGRDNSDGPLPGLDDEPTSDSDDGDHYLERRVNIADAARNFIDQYLPVSGGDERGLFGGGDAGSSSGSSEAQRLSRRNVPSCGCCQDCLSKLSPEEVDDHRLSLCETDNNEKDMLLMGVLSSLQTNPEEAFRGKRRRGHYKYSFQGLTICAGAFRFVYDIGIKQFKNLRKHLADNGITPWEHGNRHRRPHNALSFPDVQRCAKFLSAYGEEFGLPFPSPLHGRSDNPQPICRQVQLIRLCMPLMLKVAV